MYFDEERGLFVPLSLRHSTGHAAAQRDPAAGPAAESSAGRAWERLCRKAVPVILGCGICAALVGLMLLLSPHIPAPYGPILPALPIFFLDPIVDMVDRQKIIFPSRNMPWRRILVTAGYTTLLVIALNVDGVVLKAVAGSDSGLEILNLATAIAMGVLIGWRTPRLALWTILETSFAGSVLGVLTDLTFLGWYGFAQVHIGAPVAVVMAENGLLFGIAGLVGYSGLRAARMSPSRNLSGRMHGVVPPGQPSSGGANGQPGRPSESRRQRTAISVSAIALIFLVGIASYGFGYARAGQALPTPAIYPVQRQIARVGSVALSLTGVEVFQNGNAVFALTYLNTGSRAVSLTCAREADPGAATIELGDGRARHSEATFCSAHPGSTQVIGTGRSVISYAQFADARGLDRPFTFGWHLGRFSGNLPGLRLSGAAVP